MITEKECKERGGVYDENNKACRIRGNTYYNFDNVITPKEHVELILKAFNGISESLDVIKPYLIEYGVIPVKIEIDGSAADFAMRRYRDKNKFLNGFIHALIEEKKIGAITEKEKEMAMDFVKRNIENANLQQLSDMAKDEGLPNYIIKLINEEMVSDIDCTISFRPVVKASELEIRLNKEKCDIHGRSIPKWVELSEMASKHTYPHTVNIVFWYDEKEEGEW